MLGGFSVLFEAPLEKVKIVTDDSGGLRLRPQENEETKQIVIIKKNGKVRVKRYSYRLEINGDRKFFDRTFKFDEEITQKILVSIRDCFNNREGNIIGLDARPWTLDVTDENGRKNQLVGIVSGDGSVSKISSYIRETLDLDYLWLFDGKDTRDEIKKVILETRHNLNNTIKIEKLIITAKEDKIEYSQKDNKGMKIVKTYVIPNKVKELLENYSFTNSFNRILGNPKDVIEPEEKRDYQLIIENSQNDRKIYVGTYDKYSLPTDWGDFIKDITNIISYVNLILTKDGEEDVPYALENLNHDGLYQVKLQIGTAGLYFYHFEIETSYGRSYLEKRQGGIAQQVSSQSDLLRFQLTCYDKEVPSPKWYRQGVVYQIFPDRFANGLPNGEVQGRKPNSFIYGTTADKPYYIRDKNNEIVRWDFYGGNLKGILKKLPYLEELGVTTIYLNPIFLSRSNHHYDTADFLKIDPMIGNEDDLKELITEMHKKNMHLILDGVFNHVGKESIYFNASGSYGKNVGAAQSKESPYYSWFDFIHYPNDYKSWWGIKDLPVIDKDNPEYQKFIYGDSSRSVLSKWNNFGIDGWRLDVADELPMSFLRGIRKNLDSHHKQVMIGEVWEDASNKVAYDERRQYTVGDNLTGVMGYPTRIFVMDLLESTKSSQDIKKYCNEYLQLQENYPRDFWLNTLNNIGTHDTQRIKTVLHNDDNKVIQAFRTLFNLPGVPCIYYGDEVGVEGDADPDNRRFFPWGQEKSSRIIKEVKKLVDRRKKNILLQEGRLGFVIARGSHCPAFAIVRYDDQGNSVYNWLNLTQYKQIISPENCEYLCLPQNIQQKFQHELTLDSWEYKVI